MKKDYVTPEINKIEFETQELITLSLAEFDTSGIEDYGGV